MKNPDIDIICPKCRKRAAFYADEKTWTYKIQIGGKGLAICSSCGLNKKIDFDPDLYFYKIPIKDRFLYARTFDDLLRLRNYFAENKRMNGDPELDFPKVFYENRLELVKAIDSRID
ncbi:MAG: hypothetical protein KF843_05255 [Flavobacteriales bacterium]|nr:hypothetical protein [Flavobacteriales bacterium]